MILVNNKKFKIIMIILILILSLAILIYFYLPKTPVELIRKVYNYSSTKFNEYNIHKQIDIDSNIMKNGILIIHQINKNQINFTLIQKHILGYRFVKQIGSFNIENDKLRVNLNTSKIISNQNAWISCGIIYDSSVKRVLLNNIDYGFTYIGNNKEYTIIVASGDNNMPVNEIHFYDNNGVELTNYK